MRNKTAFIFFISEIFCSFTVDKVRSIFQVLKKRLSRHVVASTLGVRVKVHCGLPTLPPRSRLNLLSPNCHRGDT